LFLTRLETGKVHGESIPRALPCEAAAVPPIDRSQYIPRIGWVSSHPENNTRSCWLGFLFAAERGFFERMARYIKTDLGFEGMVVGTQAHTDAVTSQFLSPSVDIIDVPN